MYIIHIFICAYLPTNGHLLLQGKLYITKRYFAFHSNIFGYQTLLHGKWSDVLQVKKENIALIFPTAISIQTLAETFFFASFLARDQAYQLFNKLANLKVAQIETNLLNTETSDDGDTISKSDQDVNNQNALSIDCTNDLNNGNPNELEEVSVIKHLNSIVDRFNDDSDERLNLSIDNSIEPNDQVLDQSDQTNDSSVDLNNIMDFNVETSENFISHDTASDTPSENSSETSESFYFSNSYIKLITVYLIVFKIFLKFFSFFLNLFKFSLNSSKPNDDPIRHSVDQNQENVLNNFSNLKSNPFTSSMVVGIFFSIFFAIYIHLFLILFQVDQIEIKLLHIYEKLVT